MTYYHDPITYTVPLYRLASMKPWKNRTAQSCSYVLQAAEHMVRPDQKISVVGNQMLALIFWMMRAWGICPTTQLHTTISRSSMYLISSDNEGKTYPAVNMDRRMLYSLPLSLRSSLKPATCKAVRFAIPSMSGGTYICVCECLTICVCH
jgi:hypothetical protein